MIFVFYFVSKRHHYVKKLFVYFSILVLFIFIVWRGLYTLPTNDFLSFVCGILFYLAEIAGLLIFIFFIIVAHDYEADCTQEEIVYDDYQPNIDFFICTYNEDIKLVLATAHAVKALTYKNKKIYICDDGNREALKKFCQKFDIGYITRTDNLHAKAGNINNALSQTDGELFVVLDADFIVKKNYVYRSVHYFKDEKVAMVQYPQAFYNKDPFQLMNNSLYNEQELFMRFFEPALAQKNAVIHIGTNSIMRRSAIADIGGIPTKSITEDMATGLFLQGQGYKIIYVNEVYALGITPYNVKSLAEQRQRWARGILQVFRNYNPFKMRGLTFMQKLCYFNAYLYWFTSFQKIIYIFAPIVYLVFNIFVVKQSLSSYFLFFIPPMLLIVLSFRLYMPKIRTFSNSHVYDVFVAPIHASAIIKEIFHHSTKFKVTDKKVTELTNFDFKTVRFHIALVILSIVAIAMGIYKMVTQPSYIFAIIVTLGWTIYNLYGLIFAVLAAKNREILTDADALSIEVSENMSYKDFTFEATTFSYNGFRIISIGKGELSTFNVDELYSFTLTNYALGISARCIKKEKNYAVFTFENLDPDFAIDLARYYSMKLHVAKSVNLCPNCDED